ncbi:VOC family protein [Variovorax sp. 770b2]|uniref:VOC family protein n=1 Tax=Variovorax sp. 770b2 TaxID=1566271 RepID=UPI0008F31EF5|nr:VOC family protein [Variovorax sp. 770b2]SFQ40618.1 Glyoxalase/Bleomycin resistance protein/Dioxygenase superfamily protein [Variovorax sp. 770b2]
MSKLLGTVRQVGYVVHDIEKAMQHWINIGVGPWFYVEDVKSTEYTYYGNASSIPKLSIALANSGDVQIELIQQRNDAPSLYRDSLERNGECAQHVAYWTADHFQAICKHFLDRGFVEGHAGRMGAKSGPYAYFVHPELRSAMYEVSEISGMKAMFFDQIRAAATTWDGKDPIRKL